MRLKKVLLSVIIVSMLVSLVAVAGGWKQNIEVEFNSVNLEVNGANVNADNILYNGTTYVPLRKTAEILGCDVGWDGNTNTAKITQYNDNDNNLIGRIFFNLERVNTITTHCQFIVQCADWNFTKSHWTYKSSVNAESNIDYMTKFFNTISECYKFLTDNKEYIYQDVANITSTKNLDTLYATLDGMYRKLCYIYSAVNNLVNTSGYVCSENEFIYALSELAYLSSDIAICHGDIYFDALKYLNQ